MYEKWRESNHQRDNSRNQVGTFRRVQWLRIHLPMQRAWVPSLLGEQRFHMPWGQLTLSAATTEPMFPGAWAPQLRPDTAEKGKFKKVKSGLNELYLQNEKPTECPTSVSSVIQPCPTLRSHGLHPARLPCPSLSPRVCSNSSPLSQ